MNILHVMDGYDCGGVETQAYEIIKSLSIQNRNFLINTNVNQRKIFNRFKKLQNNKRLVQIFELVYKFDFQLIFLIYFFLLNNKMDAIIIYPCHKKMLFVALAAKIAGVNKVFISMQNVLIEKRYLKIFKIKFFYGFLEMLKINFVPASKSILNSVLNFNISLSKYKIIKNSCDIEGINKKVKKYKNLINSKRVKNIVMLARLDEIKDQVTLLQAYSNLNFKSWDLKIYGDGPYLNQLKKVALSLSLDPDKIFCGFTDDVPKVLSETDIFAFSTTEYEGFGKVLIEAMAADIPIIASDVSACREVLMNGEAGLLIPPKDINLWETSLKRLMESESERGKLSKKSKKYKKYYDSKKIALEWEELININ